MCSGRVGRMFRTLLFCFVFLCVSCFPVDKFNEQNENGVVRMQQKSIEGTEFHRGSNQLEPIHRNRTDIARSNFGECTVCAASVAWIKHWLRSGDSYDTIAHRVTRWCSTFHIGTREVCNGLINMFKAEVLDVLSNVTLGSYEVCEVILTKNCSGHEIPSMQWTIDIPDKKTINSSPVVSETSKTLLKVLHLTDIHVDFKYQPGSKVNCKEPLCCRQGTPSGKEPSAGFWGSLGNCDLPPWTVENLFEKFSKEKFDYILWTGDLLSHDVWNQTKEEQLHSLHYLAGLFIKHFPNTPVYPALGNHEGVPVNSFPPASMKVEESVMWLYKELSKTWRHWLPDDVGETIMRGGFYSALVGPKHRLVSLNMNFCNNYNWWLLLNSTDPESELGWLVSVLQSAEENDEKVQIIGHIPPGISDCLKTWSHNYYRIINRYKDVIGGQFFGHVHIDMLQLFYDTGYHPKDRPIGEPIAVAYLSPSLTTFKDLNPGYRIYDVEGFHDNSSWSVLDHHTYIMNLTLSNEANSSYWIHEYSAKEAYGMSSLSPKEWENTIKTMTGNQELFGKYHKFFFKSNPVKACNLGCRKTMLCSAVSGRSYDDAFCRRLFPKQLGLQTRDFGDWFNKNKLC